MIMKTYTTMIAWRRTLLIVILGGFSFVCSAQVNPKKGYILTNNGDSIHGTIDYRTDSRNCQECIFCPDGKKEYTKYSPDDIQGYRFDNDGVYYVSRTFPVEGVDTRMFAEYIIQGGVSLFYYSNHNINYYYFVDENGKIAPMKTPTHTGVHYTDIKESKRAAMMEASQMLAKSPEATKALWDSDFERQALTKLTREYDEKYCPQWGDCIQFQYDEETVRSCVFKGIRVEAGIILGSVRCAGSKHDVYGQAIAKQEFKESLNLTSPHIAAGFDLVFPRLSRNLSFQLLVGYTRINGKKTKVERDEAALRIGQVKDSEKTYKLQANALNLEAGYAYNFLPDRKFSPFVRAGINVDALLGIKTENLGNFYIRDQEIVKSHGTMIGYYAGAGVDIRLGKQSLRVLGQLSRDGAFYDFGGINFLSPEFRIGYLF